MSIGNRGFVLIELVIVTAIISTTASIAVPNYHKARCAAMAQCVANALRTFLSAQTDYNNNSIPHRYATLDSLCTGAGAGQIAYIGPALCNGRKCGYVFKLTRTGHWDYTVTAVPEPGSYCRATFYVDQTGVVRTSSTGVANASSSPYAGDLGGSGGGSAESGGTNSEGDPAETAEFASDQPPNFDPPESLDIDEEFPQAYADAARQAADHAALNALVGVANLAPEDDVLSQAGAFLSAHGVGVVLAAQDGDGDGAISFEELLGADLSAQVNAIVEATTGPDEQEAIATDDAVQEIVEAYVSELAELMGVSTCDECPDLVVPIEEMEGDPASYLEHATSALDEH